MRDWAKITGIDPNDPLGIFDPDLEERLKAQLSKRGLRTKHIVQSITRGDPEEVLECVYQDVLLRLKRREYNDIVSELEVDDGKPRTPTRLLRMKKPPKNAPVIVQAVYLWERDRRKIYKRNRAFKVGRRRMTRQHRKDCEICKGVRVDKRKYPSVPEIAERSGYCQSHIYRVFSEDPALARMREGLASARLVAHEGMGITIDELARFLLD